MRASFPSLEFAQILQAQRVELDRLAQKQEWLLNTVVNGGEVAIGRAKVGEQHGGFIPVYEWKLALHAFIVRASERSDFILGAVPLKLIAANQRSGRRQLAGRGPEERHVVFQLRIRQPAARAIVEYQ